MLALTDLKTRQQNMWALGDYSRIATPLVYVSEQLCERMDFCSGQKVLDVATGSGNTAIAAARRGTEVTGIDFVPQLLERARERAAAERLSIEFEPGDVENLPFDDAGFDAVLSTFGSMFTPDHARTASEMLRVCKPGGKIGMANWTPDGFVGKWFQVSSKYLPPSPETKPPMLWGTEEYLRELFGTYAQSIETTHRDYVIRYPSRQHWLDYFRTYFGPTKRVFDSLDEAGQQDFARDMLALVAEYDRSCNRTMVAMSDYLEVVITLR